MEILRFALGIRFDLLKDDVTERDIDSIFGELSSVLTVDDTEDLHVFGGVAPIDDRDSSGVYTVVFTNGKMKRMRAVYRKLDSDARIRCLLDRRYPFIQNNVIRRLEGMEYFGTVGSDGRLTEGSETKLRFTKTVPERKAFSEKESIVLAPNSFKGTITQKEALTHLLRAFRESMPDRNLVPILIADGGDGTLSAVENTVLSMRRSCEITSPYGKKIRADYLCIDGTTAVIESALASGLAVCDESELDPLKASSIGTGELILRAAHEGLKKIIVCLGGSATNDCGVGMANALGVRFLDSEGGEITSAADLARICSVDDSGVDPLVKEAELIAVCDVKNPLTGDRGATRTFGPQKGADHEKLDILEKGMLNMERVLNGYAGSGVCANEGAGAAGGMGAMLMALFGAKYRSGSETVLELAEFDKKLKNASLVVTGEGRIDSTTLDGKAVSVIIDRAISAKVPIAIIAGSKDGGGDRVLEKVQYCEFTDSADDPLKHFDEAVKRLINKIE